MEGGGRRITVSPRPCCGRRVLAKKRPRLVDGFVNSVKKLQRREISSNRDRAFSMTDAQERFRNIRLQVCFDLVYERWKLNLCAPEEWWNRLDWLNKLLLGETFFYHIEILDAEQKLCSKSLKLLHKWWILLDEDVVCRLTVYGDFTFDNFS